MNGLSNVLLGAALVAVSASSPLRSPIESAGYSVPKRPAHVRPRNMRQRRRTQ